MDVIKVSAESGTSAVAGAIAGVMREQNHAEVQAIGVGAVNRAVKACAIARTFLAQDGLDVVYIPSFVQVDIDGKEHTALRPVVELR
jgi:stage V sporulation protein S